MQISKQIFETSKMITKLKNKTARSMLTWAHYRFKQFQVRNC